MFQNLIKNPTEKKLKQVHMLRWKTLDKASDLEALTPWGAQGSETH